MAEFGELLEEGFGGTKLLNEGGEALETVETAVEISAEVDALVEDLFADLDGVGDPAEGELDAAAQEEEIERAAEEASKEVKDLRKVDVTDIDPWESRKKFGKWVGTEIAKGALFVVGMKVVEAAFQAAAQPVNGKQPSKEAQDALNMAKNSTAAMKIVKKVLEAWNKWLVHNYLKRKTFGSAIAEGVKMWHYQVFQSQVADLNDTRNGVVTKAATKASKSKSLADIKTLVTQEQKLIKEMKKVSNWLQEKGGKLTRGGLEEYSADETKALKLLSGKPASGGGEDDPDTDPEDPDTESNNDIDEGAGGDSDDN